MSNKKSMPTATAIIVAAGSSTRMRNADKQFILIDEIPVLAHTLMNFDRAKTIDGVIIVTRPENILKISDLIREFGILKVKSIIPGGATRQESVLSGLNELKESSLVAIHDGARPFASPKLIDDTVLAAYEHKSAAPGVIPKDTIKVLGSENTVLNTIDRDTLRLIQTPQVFYADALKLAYKVALDSGFVGTDDCSVMEFFGGSVYITEGEYTNIKVTTPEDLPVAEAIYNYLKK